MKLSLQENEDEYILTKEIPYKNLLKRETLFSLFLLLFFFLLIRLYFLIPLTAFFIFLASWQTTEDNFKLVIYKKIKEIRIYRYYMGRYKVKEFIYNAKDFSFIQIQKQVTSIKETGRFSIRMLSEAPESEKKGGKIIVLLKDLDLDDIEHAKIMSFFLGLIYDSRIKYKVELN
ncbi:MAG: hypothetical protein U0457_06620 [Candidatus Sericytochromatia bacterium]